MSTNFGLNFVSQKEIKGQALTKKLDDTPSSLVLPNNDSFPNDNVLTIETNTWELYFDSSKCRIGFDVGVIIVPPIGNPIPLFYCLKFLCINNIIEYGALISRLHSALTLGAQHIKIFDDSKLVIKKIDETYQEKHEILSKYKDLTMNLLKTFDSFTIENIS